MKKKKHPKFKQNNNDSKNHNNFHPVPPLTEGIAKSQHNNPHTSDKITDDSKNKFETPHLRIWGWIRKQKLTDWLMALATLAIFITGLLQWDAIKGQLGQMQSTSKQTDEIAHRDQRAWIGPIETIPAWRDQANNPIYIKEGVPARFGVTITNTGKSPGLKVRIKIKFITLPADENFSPNYEKIQSQSLVVIHPQARFQVPTAPSYLPITSADIDMLKNRRHILYLFGEITYEDIFKIPH